MLNASRIARLVLLVMLGLGACLITAIGGLTLGLDFEGGARFEYEVQAPAGVDPQELSASARDVIAQRLDAIGVSEASVRASGSTVSVELPGFDDEQFAVLRNVVGRTALLELVAVDDETLVVQSAADGLELETASLPRGADRFLVARGDGARERLRASLDRLVVPEGRVLAVGSYESAAWRSYVLSSAGALRGCIRDAELVLDEQTGRPEIAVDFDEIGRARLAELTERQRERRIAIVLDGEVLSAPIVREPITGGSARITLGAGDRTTVAAMAEAESLVAALRAGALPAPMVLTSESVISAGIAPATRWYAALAALVTCLVLTVAAALRYRTAGALWIPLGAFIAIALALALTSLVDGVVTAPYCIGVAGSIAWVLATGAIPLELARRGHVAWLGWMALLCLHTLSFSASAMLFGLSAGPMRGLAAGMLLASPGGALVAALGATALAARRDESRK